jgi:hypothetical protein
MGDPRAAAGEVVLRRVSERALGLAELPAERIVSEALVGLGARQAYRIQPAELPSM